MKDQNFKTKNELLAEIKRLNAIIADLHRECVQQLNSYAIGNIVWVESERAHAVVVTVGVDVYTVRLETPNAPTIEVAASELARGIPF